MPEILRTAMQTRYDWKRFWCPLGGSISLADGGFLADPEREYARYFHEHVVPLSQIDEAPCLVLLGEPGMGKTVALESYRAEVEPTLRATGNTVAQWRTGGLASDSVRLASDSVQLASEAESLVE